MAGGVEFVLILTDRAEIDEAHRQFVGVGVGLCAGEGLGREEVGFVVLSEGDVSPGHCSKGAAGAIVGCGGGNRGQTDQEGEGDQAGAFDRDVWFRAFHRSTSRPDGRGPSVKT